MLIRGHFEADLFGIELERNILVAHGNTDILTPRIMLFSCRLSLAT